MTPSYRVQRDGTVRPVFLYTVDAVENFIFTVCMALGMVYAMICYNSSGNL